MTSLNVDEILECLAASATLEEGALSGLSALEHGLQTAAVLRAARPGDDELAVAGLVHDIGYGVGAGVVAHAEAGAAAVRAALGARVAGLVGLHVMAKRYLVAREAGYGATLAADSAASLALEGGAMTAAEMAAFEGLALAGDACVLRRADEAAKVPGLAVMGMEGWSPVLRAVAAMAAAAAGRAG